MSEAREGGAPADAAPEARAQAWRWVLVTAALALARFELVSGQELSPLGIGMVLAAALHGPWIGGAAGGAAGLVQAAFTGHLAYPVVLAMVGWGLGWSASRIPLPLTGITFLWVAASAAPILGTDALLAGASDAAGLSVAVRALIAALASSLPADLLLPFLRGAWGPAPGRRLPPLRPSTYLALAITGALFLGALLVLRYEHRRLRRAAQRVTVEHMRAHSQASATDVQNWLEEGRQIAEAAARGLPRDLATFAEGARSSTPDLLGLVIEEPGAAPRGWDFAGCHFAPGEADLAVLTLDQGCAPRAVARVVEAGDTRATAWLDLHALPSRVRAWTWVRELDNGRAWIEDASGRVLVWSGGGDVWLPMPATWTRRPLLPDISLWDAPQGAGTPGSHWEAHTKLAAVPWHSWVLVPPGKRQADLEVAALFGQLLCLGLGLGGLVILPALLRRLPWGPEPRAPRPEVDVEPHRAPSPPAPPRESPSHAAWSALLGDAVEAAARAAGVAPDQITVETPPGGLPHAPPPRLALGRALHLVLDEALAQSEGPWTIRLEPHRASAGGRSGVAITLLDPRPPPSAEELGAVERPVERAEEFQALALARSLAAESGVRLELTSSEGQRRTRLVLEEGSAPTSSPPAPPSREHPDPPGVPPRPPGPSDAPASSRVLLAEDNEANRLLIQALLASRGWTCDAVAGASEAIEAAATGRYGLVLMDLHMPGLDGLGATREIRAAEAARGAPRTPVLAITADMVEGTRERCLSAGMDEFLPKPVELDTLATLVKRYVGPPAEED